MQTTLKQSLSIQKRVIGALLMREIITRYGRNNIGFLWLFVEPLLVTVIIATVWGLRGSGHGGINIYAFMLTGYPLMMMWRQSSNLCIGAIGANQGLLFHRNIRVFDVFLARVLLEVMGATAALFLLFGVFYILKIIPAPVNAMYMVFAWGLMAWFALGLGMVLGVLAQMSEFFKRVWQAMSIVLMFASGAFYLVDSLSKSAQKIALKIPMVHGTEMMRHGYFGDLIRTYESIGYIVIINLVLTFVGMVLIQRFRNGVSDR